MSESSTTTADDAPRTGAPERPRTINIALLLILAGVVFAVLAAIAWFGHDSQFVKLFIDTNNKLAADKRVKNYDSVKALSDVHRQRKNVVTQAVIISLALLFLAFAMTKMRTASAARWGYVIVTVLTAVGSVVPIHGVPILLNIGRVGQGLCELAAVVLLFLPASRQYFRECKGLGAEDPNARPRLRDLIAPRGARAAGDAAPAGRPGGRTPVSVTKAPASGTDAAAAARGRSKNRSEQAAVAKGAELARARAKASKSRRTDPGR